MYLMTLQVSTADFDYESSASYRLSVQVTDDGQPRLSDGFPVTIDVTDANDPPSQLTFTG
jgi:hypothetical protein